MNESLSFHAGCDRALAEVNDMLEAEAGERRRLQRAFGTLLINLRGRAESLRMAGQIIGAEENEIAAEAIHAILGPGACPACFGKGTVDPVGVDVLCTACGGSGRWVVDRMAQ